MVYWKLRWFRVRILWTIVNVLTNVWHAWRYVRYSLNCRSAYYDNDNVDVINQWQRSNKWKNATIIIKSQYKCNIIMLTNLNIMTQYNQTRQHNIQNLHKLLINKISILTVSPSCAAHVRARASRLLARILQLASCQVRASYLQLVMNQPESLS